MGHLSHTQEQLAAAETRLEEEGQHKDAMRGELEKLEEALEKKKEQVGMLWQCTTVCT